MSTHFFPMVRALALPAAVSLAFQVMAAAPAMAQDPIKVDAKHYKVEFENDKVRVLRITYGPHEKSVMHAHPPSVAVFLTDATTKFTLPDDKTVPGDFKAGMVQWEPGGKHLPENVGDKPFELILVELKGKHAAAKAK
jgi:quercetin dioxygenase-like cupin family protein